MRWRGPVRGTGPWASLSAAVPVLLLLLTACASEPPAREVVPAQTASDAASGAPSRTPGRAPGTYWRPEPGTDWQWQLSGRLDLSVDAPVYDIDGFENGVAEVAELHRRDRKVICYLSTGAWEDFRPDAGRFPASVLGKGNGWEGERWLDIRRTDVLAPLMEARIEMCAEKGFDAVEPDNMDAYLNPSGFPLTADDQLRYNRLIARLAHEHGLAVGLKNDLDQIPELEPDFDFAVNEQCAQYGECEAVTPFIEAGKAVFHAEYELEPAEFCAESRRLELSSLRKEYALDPWRRTCPTEG